MTIADTLPKHRKGVPNVVSGAIQELVKVEKWEIPSVKDVQGLEP
jgi:hypothetical protein